MPPHGWEEGGRGREKKKVGLGTSTSSGPLDILHPHLTGVDHTEDVPHLPEPPDGPRPAQSWPPWAAGNARYGPPLHGERASIRLPLFPSQHTSATSPTGTGTSTSTSTTGPLFRDELVAKTAAAGLPLSLIARPLPSVSLPSGQPAPRLPCACPTLRQPDTAGDERGKGVEQHGRTRQAWASLPLCSRHPPSLFSAPWQGWQRDHHHSRAGPRPPTSTTTTTRLHREPPRPRPPGACSPSAPHHTAISHGKHGFHPPALVNTKIHLPSYTDLPRLPFSSLSCSPPAALLGPVLFLFLASVSPLLFLLQRIPSVAIPFIQAAEPAFALLFPSFFRHCPSPGQSA